MDQRISDSSYKFARVKFGHSCPMRAASSPLPTSCPPHDATPRASRAGPASKAIAASHFPTHSAPEVWSRFRRNFFRFHQTPNNPRSPRDKPNETPQTAGPGKMPVWDDAHANELHDVKTFRRSFDCLKPARPRSGPLVSAAFCPESIQGRLLRGKQEKFRWISSLCRPAVLHRVPRVDSCIRAGSAHPASRTQTVGKIRKDERPCFGSAATITTRNGKATSAELNSMFGAVLYARFDAGAWDAEAATRKTRPCRSYLDPLRNPQSQRSRRYFSSKRTGEESTSKCGDKVARCQL